MTDSAFATADVLIVGAGSAGCVVAERLSRDPRRTVVLIDAGPATPAAAAQTRLTRLPIEPGAPRVRRYREARGRDVVRGTGIGGSSVVNGGYFLRGHREDYAAWPWPIAQIAAQFDIVEQAMSVSAFDDADLGPVAAAFEAAADSLVPGSNSLVERAQRVETPSTPSATSPWPTTGLLRVRSNRRDGRRVTAADAFLPADRPNLLVLGTTAARSLVVRHGRVTGVETSRGRLDAGAVVLTAGAIGSGGLVAPILGALPIHEHAERLVRFTPRRPVSASALLQTVLHTADGLEIRCYGDDFASFIDGVPRSGIALGVADMGVGTAGVLSSETLDLGEPDAASLSRLAGGVDLVRAMLESQAFAHLVEPGSVRVDDAVGLSSHAWGTLPLGTAVADDGAVRGVDGLYVADGSVLPAPLRSGPHASVMAVAGLISNRWLSERRT